jgi:hypothetical protein
MMHTRRDAGRIRRYCGGLAAAVLLAVGAAPLLAAVGTYRIQDYFPLGQESAWILQDVDGDPGDDEGFAWTILGNGPQAIGIHQAWGMATDTVSGSDSREGDRHYWNTYNSGADLGLYGLYESAGASPLAANQTIAFGQPLQVGAERMAVGWSSTTSASATFRVTLPFLGTIPLDGTATGTANLVRHRDQLDTPLGTFYDILVLTLDVHGTTPLHASLPLFRGTLFLARGIGLVRFVRTLDPDSIQAQAISGGLLGGVPIAPLPPPPDQGIAVEANERVTSEDGGTASFTIALTSPPLADVTLTLACDDPTEASLATNGRSLDLLFTPGDWGVPQRVSLIGLDDPDWDGHQTVRVTFAVQSDDPAYAGLDPGPWALTFTNLDNERLDIEDYFMLLPGSQWHYVAYDEEAAAVLDDAVLSWSVEDVRPTMHGAQVTAIRTDLAAAESPLNGAANFWSLDAAGRLLLHGVRFPTQIEQDVEYLGGVYHAVVPAQDIVFAAPLVIGTRGMVAHEVLHGATTASLRVSGLPLITSLPVQVASHSELLGMRERKRTPAGVFEQVPALRLILSAEAMGESIQDQGGVLFLARNAGVICQNAADQPDGGVGMALSAGTAGTSPIRPDGPADGLLSMAIPLHFGWNLVAIPFEPEVATPQGVFGGAILGCAWELRGRACIPARTIRPGHGYWAYRNPAFAPGQATATVVVRGTPASQSMRRVQSGWVLVGLIGDAESAVLPLPVLSTGRGASSSPVAWIWHDGDLVPVQELTPGVGAWLLIHSPGPLDLAPVP